MRKLLKAFIYLVVFAAVLLLGIYAYAKWGLAPDKPEIKQTATVDTVRSEAGESFYRIGSCWLRKTSNGLWEEYSEGEPYERGVIKGKLEKDLLYSLESAFVEKIHELIPNKKYLSFLDMFTRMFNRNLADNVPDEIKKEIYGESLSAPKEFDYISPAYERMLNYHAAHDIGHALQNLALVGCSSFGVWGGHSADSSMLIGRNLDFYLGDKFARDKIVYFCNPTEGHKFAMITWAGFMGCVSGMNEKGITVTINAAKSDIPASAATPISILAREILQYAANIDEAFAIAKKRKTFVCETLMIGSAPDKKTALIEKSISKTVLFNCDTNFIVCTNHYQSDSFKNDKNNIENMATSSSYYRFLRLNELLDRHYRLSYTDAAAILRDQKGLHNKNIGAGNEKALNQLIAHHAVIFQPEKLRFWISANPYQLGEFVCYDLNKVFAVAPAMNASVTLNDTSFTIPKDSFLLTGWKDFVEWRALKREFKIALKEKREVAKPNKMVSDFIHYNPENWETYQVLGSYYKSKNDKLSARKYFELALTKEINDTHEADDIQKQLSELQ